MFLLRLALLSECSAGIGHESYYDRNKYMYHQHTMYSALKEVIRLGDCCVHRIGSTRNQVSSFILYIVVVLQRVCWHTFLRLRTRIQKLQKTSFSFSLTRNESTPIHAFQGQVSRAPAFSYHAPKTKSWGFEGTFAPLITSIITQCWRYVSSIPFWT